MKTKTCRDCGDEKSLDDFYVNCSMKDNHESICKSCRKARTTANRQRIDKAPYLHPPSDLS